MIAALAVAAAVAGEATPATDPAQQYAELQHIWQQSCEVRAYATFDDLCDSLKKQMRLAERAQRDAARKRPAAAKPQVQAAAPND